MFINHVSQKCRLHGGSVLPRELAPYLMECHHMGKGCYGPGDRIGQVQHVQGTVRRKYSEYPEHPESACPSEGYKHGDDGLPQPSQASHHAVHDSAKEIGCADNFQPEHPVAQHLRV